MKFTCLLFLHTFTYFYTRDEPFLRARTEHIPVDIPCWFRNFSPLFAHIHVGMPAGIPSRHPTTSAPERAACADRTRKLTQTNYMNVLRRTFILLCFVLALSNAGFVAAADCACSCCSTAGCSATSVGSFNAGSSAACTAAACRTYGSVQASYTASTSTTSTTSTPSSSGGVQLRHIIGSMMLSALSSLFLL
jgi:hypothetical protein